jgi:hypothetical protein
LGKSNKNLEKESKSGEVTKLKKHIRHLENEITQLKSQLRTYDRVFSKNVTFLKEKTRGLSLEDLIIGANAELNLETIKEEKVNNFQDMEKKWKCFQCQVGILKMIIIPRGDTNSYFRQCNNPKCKHRTDVKEYTEEVDKGI